MLTCKVLIAGEWLHSYIPEEMTVAEYYSKLGENVIEALEVCDTPDCTQYVVFRKNGIALKLYGDVSCSTVEKVKIKLFGYAINIQKRKLIYQVSEFQVGDKGSMGYVKLVDDWYMLSRGING